MSPCVTFFEATIDMLWSLIRVGMALTAALLSPSSGHAVGDGASPVVLRAAFARTADLPALVAKLQDADPRERVRAACALQALGSDARGAIAALVDRLSDDSPTDPLVCGSGRHYWSVDIDRQTTPGEEAAAALVAIGTEALPSVIAATRSPEWVARRNAVWALGAIGDERAVDPLVAALADDMDRVRARAAWALGAVGSGRASTALVAALKDSSARVRRQAAWALGTINR